MLSLRITIGHTGWREEIQGWIDACLPRQLGAEAVRCTDHSWYTQVEARLSCHPPPEVVAALVLGVQHRISAMTNRPVPIVIMIGDAMAFVGGAAPRFEYKLGEAPMGTGLNRAPIRLGLNRDT